MDKKVIERTSQLQNTNKDLENEIRERTRADQEVKKLNEDLERIVSEQNKLITELEDERNRRISAERDAIWKDISFSAAHKMGNPIFAIENNLDPLVKRIIELGVTKHKRLLTILDNQSKRQKQLLSNSSL